MQKVLLAYSANLEDLGGQHDRIEKLDQSLILLPWVVEGGVDHDADVARKDQHGTVYLVRLPPFVIDEVLDVRRVKHVRNVAVHLLQELDALLRRLEQVDWHLRLHELNLPHLVIEQLLLQPIDELIRLCNWLLEIDEGFGELLRQEITVGQIDYFPLV